MNGSEHAFGPTEIAPPPHLEPILDILPEYDHILQKLILDLLSGRHIGQFLTVYSAFLNEPQYQVLVDFGIHIVAGSGHVALDAPQLTFPPCALIQAEFVVFCGPVESIEDIVFSLFFLQLDHVINLGELVLHFFHQHSVLFLEGFPIFSNLVLSQCSFFQFIFQHFEAGLIVPLDGGNGVTAGHHRMVFMIDTLVQTIDTEKFTLVLTVEGDEVIMVETLLGDGMIVASRVAVQHHYQVVLPGGKFGDVVNVFVLQKDAAFCGAPLRVHRVGFRARGQGFTSVRNHYIFISYFISLIISQAYYINSICIILCTGNILIVIDYSI